MKHDLASKQHIYARALTAYWRKHLDDALTVEGLAGVANFSKFHFIGSFHEYCGVNIGRYIQLMKLKRASTDWPSIRKTGSSTSRWTRDLNPPSLRARVQERIRPDASGFRKRPAWADWSLRYHSPFR